MNIIRLLEILVIVLGLLFVITQVIAPLLRGRPMFGMFRYPADLEKNLAKEREKADEKALKDQIRQEQQQNKKSTTTKGQK